MSEAIIKTTTRFLPLLALLACSSTEDAVTDAPASSRNVGGIEYSAETLVMESFPVQLATIVTARNTTVADVELQFGDPCVVRLRAYTSEARSGEPAWDQDRIMGCIAVIFADTIPAGDTAQYRARSDGYEILGDSLPDGRYWLSAVLDPEGERIELPAGVVDLGVPR